MKKKIKLSINQRKFEIEFEEEFALYLENEIENNFQNKEIDVKVLLQAYIQKCYEDFLINKDIKSLNQKLQNTKLSR